MKQIEKLLFINSYGTQGTLYDPALVNPPEIVLPPTGMQTFAELNHFIISSSSDAVMVPVDLCPLWMQSTHLLNKVREGVAILDEANAIVWTNRPFQTWFPEFNPKIPHQDILNVLGSPVFLSSEGEEVNPLKQIRRTGKNVSSEICVNKNRFFEMDVLPYEGGGRNPSYLLLFLRDVTRRKEQEMKLISLHNAGFELNQMMVDESMDLDQREELLKENILFNVQTLLNHEMLELRTLDPLTNELTLFVQYGMTPEIQSRTVFLGAEDGGINAMVAKTRKTYVCNDTENDPYYISGGINARSSLTVPILFEGNILGVLNVESTKLNAFSEMDVRFIEIFVREIAIALNMLKALEYEKLSSIQVSVEKIHGKVAKPVADILESAINLNEKFRQGPVDATADPTVQMMLYTIIKTSREIQYLIRQIGHGLSLGTAYASEKRDEELRKVFEKKRILLVDPDEQIFRQVSDILGRLDCSVEYAKTGASAIAMVTLSFEEEIPYFAILTAVENIPDYPHTTSFIFELGALYGKKHPPLVLLQQVGHYNLSHSVVNAKTRYPAAQETGRPPVEKILLEAIRRAVARAEVTKPDFDAPIQTYPSLGPRG
ncbi:MAG: GAF domain-containing protein [Planctomycetia bacterium]|nr:GAF domain-containing protein [Planctomycetia bacterium]